MCWIPLCSNKHKQRRQDMIPPTNNRRYRRTQHHGHAEIVTDITTRNSERTDTKYDDTKRLKNMTTQHQK